MEVWQSRRPQGGEVRQLALLHDLWPTLLLHRSSCQDLSRHSGRMAMPKMQMVPNLQANQSR